MPRRATVNVDCRWSSLCSLQPTGLHRCLADITHDTEQLGDPSTRLAAIGRIAQGDPDDEPDPFEVMLMMDAMADAVGAPWRPKRPARPKRR